MTPVFQTEFYCGRDWAERGVVPGNCAQAAVASLLDLPLDAVPHFAAEPGPGPSDWLRMRTWAREELGCDFGWGAPDSPYVAGMRDDFARIGERYCLATVRNGLGGSNYGLHCVVWDLVEGRVAHNPMPGVSRDLSLEVVTFEWLCGPYEPDPITQYEHALEREGAAA